VLFYSELEFREFGFSVVCLYVVPRLCLQNIAMNIDFDALKYIKRN